MPPRRSERVHVERVIEVSPPKTPERFGRGSVEAVRILMYIRGRGVCTLRRIKSAKHFPGMLELPGGKLEHDDPTCEYAARLETLEEIGVDIVVENGSIYRWEKVPGHFSGFDERAYRCEILVAYPMKPFQIEDIDKHIRSRRPREHDEVVWIDPIGEHLSVIGSELLEETLKAICKFRVERLPVDYGDRYG